MYNQLLISLVISAVPILAFVFVGVLLLQKFYVKIRSKFNATVNCWFCNRNTRVPYLDSNSWTCPHCEQYNGFTKDGDYNREMFQQLDCSGSSATLSKHSSSFSEHNTSSSMLGIPRNGFCYECNEAQRLKVEKLSRFEPKNESRFDDELKSYKQHLEEQYRLCTTCELHLHKVLREKKKMVLGSKFLDFIIRGAETLKKPHFERLRVVQRQQWKQRLTVLTTLLTIINMCCLCGILPTITREQLIASFGEPVGQRVFIVSSHVLALGRVVGAYFERIVAYPSVVKFTLFVRTIFMMLLYTLGLKLPQIARYNFCSIYILFCPFALLGLTFLYNIVDRFKLTRFTFLLPLWSTFAGGLVEEQLYFSPNTLMLISSLLTLLLTVSNRVEASPKLHDSSGNSFHKIYSEDYLSDEDTISMLSQQLNSSADSTTRSTSMYHDPSTPLTPIRVDSMDHSVYTKSPITSSRLSLHNLPHQQPSPNAYYKSCHSQYAPSFCDFNTAASTTTLPASSSFYGTNSNRNLHKRPQAASIYGSTFSERVDTYKVLPPVNNPFNSIHSNYAANPRVFSANTTTLHSPFSLSKGAEYQQLHSVENARNLLTPSRLDAARLTSSASATSWLTAADCFSQRTSFPEPSTALKTSGENQSRGSSQSSGFESQNDRLNVSRENSFGTESTDLMQHTKSLDTSKAFHPIDVNVRENSFNLDTADLRQHTKAMHTPRAFQPIKANVRQTHTPQSLTFSNAQSTSPCNMNWIMTSEQGAPFRRQHFQKNDSFNLHRIHEELPTIKRGDLLKKWKESQMVS